MARRATSGGSFDVVILGGGMAGLGAARVLKARGFDVMVLEQRARPGGLAATQTDDGFTFDVGPHFIESSLPEKLGALHLCHDTQNAEELYFDGRFHRMPFGLLKSPGAVLSVAGAQLRGLLRPQTLPPTNLEALLVTRYGQKFGAEIVGGLIGKWSGSALRDLSIDLVARLDPPSLRVVLFHLYAALRRAATGENPHLARQNVRWVYPEGGIGRLAQFLVDNEHLPISLETTVLRIEHANERWTAVATNRGTFRARAFVNTLPLCVAAGLLGEGTPFDAYRPLACQPIILTMLKLRRPHLLRHQWAWFPEARFPFYRVSEMKRVAPEFGPPDKTLVTAELPAGSGARPWNASDNNLVGATFDALAPIYHLRTGDLLGGSVIRIPFGYPAYRLDQDALRTSISFQSPVSNVFLAGRFGLHRYIMTEGAFDSGVACADVIAKKGMHASAPSTNLW
jgi:protoporphyrinogen oxidase